MPAVLCLCRARAGVVGSPSLRAAATAGDLARRLGGPSCAIVASDDRAVVEQLDRTGVDEIIVLEGGPLDLAEQVDHLTDLVREIGPRLVVAAHDSDAVEAHVLIGLALDGVSTTDCTLIDVDDGELVVVKPVHGGHALVEMTPTRTPAFVTLRDSTGDAPAAREHPARVRWVPSDGARRRGEVVLEGAADVDSAGSLLNARIVVSGGRGVGRTHWHLVDQLAEAIGAEVGASRPITDEGWLSADHQVGMTGGHITADLYVALGVSGAVQHLAGLSAVRHVVAVNSDPEAPIFDRAELGVVGDCRQVVPAMVDRLHERRDRIEAGVGGDVGSDGEAER